MIHSMNDNEEGSKIYVHTPFQTNIAAMTSSLVLMLTLLVGVPLPSAATTTTTTLQPQIISGSTRYWNSMESDDIETIQRANEKLLDHAVGTINNMFYDRTGGNDFDPQDFYKTWRNLRKRAYSFDNNSNNNSNSNKNNAAQMKLIKNDDVISFDNREGAVNAMRYLVGTLQDPYSKYLTREELRGEISGSTNDFGFLGTGMYVEVPSSGGGGGGTNNGASSSSGSIASALSPLSSGGTGASSLLSRTRADNLPRITAVSPHSPAELGGVSVGDRIAGIANANFIGFSRPAVSEILSHYTGSRSSTIGGEKEYFGSTPVLTIASPVLNDMEDDNVIVGYRLSKLRLPTGASSSSSLSISNFAASEDDKQHGGGIHTVAAMSGGDAICNWQLLTPGSSIFNNNNNNSNDSTPTFFSPSVVDTAAIQKMSFSQLSLQNPNKNQNPSKAVGYIRLTRFSRISTTGFVNAVQQLEELGAQSYIIDVRNNYGGVIQEAMLTASSLLRELHAPLCYTLNSRGGFTPHDVEEYVIDARYPGYLLSGESSDVVLNGLKKSNPQFWKGDGWDPPSNYASLHEQEVKRGLKVNTNNKLQQLSSNKQKDVVIIMNEGTASAAEVFVSSLHDNGRTVALVGSKTFGKGLIQHTFPMPDGGGLRLTVAEYLTPSLQHVSKVGGAQYSSKSGRYVGGGIQPEVYCESRGIPNNPGADLCVSLALDALDDSDADLLLSSSDGGDRDGIVIRKGPRKTISAGVVRVS